MSKLKIISVAIDEMFPDAKVVCLIDVNNPAMGTVNLTLGEWIRSAEDFPAGMLEAEQAAKPL